MIWLSLGIIFIIGYLFAGYFMYTIDGAINPRQPQPRWKRWAGLVIDVITLPVWMFIGIIITLVMKPFEKEI
jgi:hypothetical protein